MAIRFICPVCKTTYTVNDRDGGKKADCKNCGQRIQVPAPQRAKTILGEVLPSAPESGATSQASKSPSWLPVAKHVDRPRQEVTDYDLAETTDPESDRMDSSDANDPAPYYGYLPPIRRSRRLPFTLVVATVCLGGLVLLAVLSVLLLRLFNDGGNPLSLFPSDHDGDGLVWAPPSSELVVGLDIKELNASPEFRDLMKDMEPRGGGFGFKMDEVEKMLVASRTTKSAGTDNLFVYRLNRTYDPNKPIKSGSAKPQKRGGQTYVEFTNNDRLFNPSANVVVISDSDTFLFESMDGKPGEVRIGSDLRKAIRQADGPVWGAAVGPSAQPDTRSMFNLFNTLFEKKSEPHPLRLAETLSTKVRSNRTEVKEVFTYSSQEKAKIAAEQISTSMKRLMTVAEAVENPKDPTMHFLRVIYDSYKVEASGSEVVSTFQIPHQELKRFLTIFK